MLGCVCGGSAAGTEVSPLQQTENGFVGKFGFGSELAGGEKGRIVFWARWHLSIEPKIQL